MQLALLILACLLFLLAAGGVTHARFNLIAAGLAAWVAAALVPLLVT